MAQNLQPDLLKTSRLHYLYAAALVIQVLVYDAWQLIAPAAVLQRWVVITLFLWAVTGVWYFAHSGRSADLYHRLTFMLIVADIALASFAVYTQRGMAARAIALYAIPIAVATILRSRTALVAVAMLSIASYVATAVTYFVINFNEGFKIELYGEVGFYSAMLLLLAAILGINAGKKS